MVFSWGTSEPVVARIFRNRREIEAEYVEDVKEWIAEAIGKMKTPYTVAIQDKPVSIRNHKAQLPCKIQGILCIEYNGCKLMFMTNSGPTEQHPRGSAGDSIFQSIVPIYTTSGDLTDVEDGRSKFPRDILVSLDRLPFDHDHWYKINGRYLESNICDGEIKVWTSGPPKDENGYPLIPEVEEYEHAIYRYVRMMLIEAGCEDKVMSYATAVQLWEQDSGRAISAVSYPTPEESAASINRNVRLFGAELDDYFNNNISL